MRSKPTRPDSEVAETEFVEWMAGAKRTRSRTSVHARRHPHDLAKAFRSVSDSSHGVRRVLPHEQIQIARPKEMASSKFVSHLVQRRDGAHESCGGGEVAWNLRFPLTCLQMHVSNRKHIYV